MSPMESIISNLPFDDLSEPLWKLSRSVGITPMSTHTRLKERAPAGRGLLDI